MAEWQCLPGIAFPVRLNANGDPECSSADGVHCYDGSTDCLATLASLPQSCLACGPQHAIHLGVTGYEQRSHWCFRTREMLTGPAGRAQPGGKGGGDEVRIFFRNFLQFVAISGNFLQFSRNFSDFPI